MAEPKTNELMEKIVSLCKRRGFIFPSSEIYGGLNGFWDYGPLGAELKRNVKDAWWTTMTRLRDDVVGLEATIIMHPKIWQASGHVDTFSDPMCTCDHCKRLIRPDQAFDILVESGWGKDVFAEYRDGAFTTAQVVAPEATMRKWLLGNGRRMSQALAAVIDPAAVLAVVERGLNEISTPALQRWQLLASLLTCRTWEEWLAVGPKLPCPHCGARLPQGRPFNLMFKTYVGPVVDEENVAYLRPETAQAIFAQFKNVADTSRQKVPFGIGQMGKAFRNEVTPRNFTFRSREFEQMELEFFIKPDEAVAAMAGRVAEVVGDGWKGEPQADWGWEVWHKYWVEQRIRFYEGIGLPRTAFEEYWQKPDELAHYARACVDILYKFPFGTQELEGIAARSDFDLTQHETHSGKPMGIFDEELRAAWGKLDEAKKTALRANFLASKTAALMKKGATAEEAKTQADGLATVFFDKLAKGQFIPHVIEPSAGVDRLILALLCHAYSEVTSTDDKGKSETRVVLRFHPRIAPVKVGVFPLLKNKPELVAKAQAVRELLRPHLSIFYDEGGAIGRRYARQDEAGTPFCVTIDFDTLGEKPELLDTVTLRHRDTGAQERIAIGDLLGRILPLVR